MFTGIVTDVGRVREVRRGAAGARLVVEAPRLAGEVAPGDSVAVNGACLTVTGSTGGRMSFDVVPETLERTTLGSLDPRRPVNLEGALRVGDRLSGHLVTGHVDGVGEILCRSDGSGQATVRTRAPESLSGLLLERGSIALDGVSLTIRDVAGPEFSVAIVPHTLARTTLRDLGPGDRVNLEADVIARWVARLLHRPEREEGVTLDALRRAGFEMEGSGEPRDAGSGRIRT